MVTFYYSSCDVLVTYRGAERYVGLTRVSLLKESNAAMVPYDVVDYQSHDPIYFRKFAGEYPLLFLSTRFVIAIYENYTNTGTFQLYSPVVIIAWLIWQP